MKFDGKLRLFAGRMALALPTYNLFLRCHFLATDRGRHGGKNSGFCMRYLLIAHGCVEFVCPCLARES
jgi:hypothetical protein